MFKKEKLQEQYQKKVSDILNQKQEYMDRVEALEGLLKLSEEKISEVSSEHERSVAIKNEKIHEKESMLDKTSEELKHIRSTAKSQENTITYLRKKVDEL